MNSIAIRELLPKRGLMGLFPVFISNTSFLPAAEFVYPTEDVFFDALYSDVPKNVTISIKR